MTSASCMSIVLAFAMSVAVAGPSLAQTETEKANAKRDSQSALEKAIADNERKLVDEIDRVPGLRYDDISKISRRIPGRVQIPDPTARNSTTRAISVPGGLVSEKCKHFARGYVARGLAKNGAGLSQRAALSKVITHLRAQPAAYARIAGARGLKRSDGAFHDANCPICGPLNAVEIECHKSAVKKSPVRQLMMFDYDSDVLRGGHLATIEKIRTLLEKDPGLQVALIGRASLPGGPVFNFDLSARRIASVWRGLAKAGVPVDQIVAIPIGEDEPHLDLQLAIDYGLESVFADVGQKPLNQSVYMVVFRPDRDSAAVTPATSGALRSSAAIEVTVTNADSSELLQGVMVTAVSDQNMESTSVKTDANGKGTLRNLEKGTWTLYFEREGFDTNIAELSLEAGETKSNAVRLQAKQSKVVKRASDGAIAVTVTNADSSVLLRGVSVTAINAHSGHSEDTVTDVYGKGRLRDLEQGEWSIKFESDGYITHTEEVRLRKGETKSATITLKTAEKKPARRRTPKGDTEAEKRKKLMLYLTGKIGIEELEK